MPEPEIPADTWRELRGVGPAVGDVCVAVPLPAFTHQPYLVIVPELSGLHALTVMLGYALIVRTYGGSAVYLPIATGQLFNDPARLHDLVERGRSGSELITLPPLPGAWDEPVAAFLRLPQAIDSEYLATRRVVSMGEDGSRALSVRFAKACGVDD